MYPCLTPHRVMVGGLGGGGALRDDDFCRVVTQTVAPRTGRVALCCPVHPHINPAQHEQRHEEPTQGQQHGVVQAELDRDNRHHFLTCNGNMSKFSKNNIYSLVVLEQQTKIP